MKLYFAGGKELPNAANGSWGMAVKDDADRSRIATVGDGNTATAGQIHQAAAQWPQASAEDFEHTGKRTYVDRASGVAYKRVHGAPLLSVGSDANRGITCFFVANEELVFLQPAAYDPALTTWHGPVVGMQVTTHDGGSALL